MDPRMYPQGRDNRLDFTGFVPDKSDGGIVRAGTSATPLLSGAVTSVKAISVYVKSSAPSGSAEAAYIRQYADVAGSLTINALRAFASVNDVTIGNARGAHISLSFGSASGKVTGLGVAVEATLHVPNGATQAGTLAAIKAAINSDGASSDILSASVAFLRFDNQGNATGMAKVDATGYLFETAGLTDGSGKLYLSTAPGTLAASLRVKVEGITYYLPLYSAQT